MTFAKIAAGREHRCTTAVERSRRRAASGRYEEFFIMESVYLTPCRGWSSAPMLVASDKPRWTEPPLERGVGGSWGMKVQPRVLGSAWCICAPVRLAVLP